MQDQEDKVVEGLFNHFFLDTKWVGNIDER